MPPKRSARKAAKTSALKAPSRAPSRQKSCAAARPPPPPTNRATGSSAAQSSSEEACAARAQHLRKVCQEALQRGNDGAAHRHSRLQVWQQQRTLWRWAENEAELRDFMADVEQDLLSMACRLLPYITTQCNASFLHLAERGVTPSSTPALLSDAEEEGSDSEEEEATRMQRRAREEHKDIYTRLRGTIAAACTLGHRACQLLWGAEGSGKSRLLRLLAAETRRRPNTLVFYLDGAVLRSEAMALQVMAEQLLSFLLSPVSTAVRAADWSIRTGTFDFGRVFGFPERLAARESSTNARAHHHQREPPRRRASAGPKSHLPQREWVGDPFPSETAEASEEEETPLFMSTAIPHQDSAASALPYLHATLLLLRHYRVSILVCIQQIETFGLWCDQLLYVLAGLLHDAREEGSDAPGNSPSEREEKEEGGGGGFIFLLSSTAPDTRQLEKRLSSRLTPEARHVPLLQWTPRRLVRATLQLLREFHQCRVEMCATLLEAVEADGEAETTWQSKKQRLLQCQAEVLDAETGKPGTRLPKLLQTWEVELAREWPAGEDHSAAAATQQRMTEERLNALHRKMLELIPFVDPIVLYGRHSPDLGARTRLNTASMRFGCHGSVPVRWWAAAHSPGAPTYSRRSPHVALSTAGPAVEAPMGHKRGRDEAQEEAMRKTFKTTREGEWWSAYGSTQPLEPPEKSDGDGALQQRNEIRKEFSAADESNNTGSSHHLERNTLYDNHVVVSDVVVRLCDAALEELNALHDYTNPTRTDESEEEEVGVDQRHRDAPQSIAHILSTPASYTLSAVFQRTADSRKTTKDDVEGLDWEGETATHDYAPSIAVSEASQLFRAAFAGSLSLLRRPSQERVLLEVWVALRRSAVPHFDSTTAASTPRAEAPDELLASDAESNSSEGRTTGEVRASPLCRSTPRPFIARAAPHQRKGARMWLPSCWYTLQSLFALETEGMDPARFSSLVSSPLAAAQRRAALELQYRFTAGLPPPPSVSIGAGETEEDPDVAAASDGVLHLLQDYLQNAALPAATVTDHRLPAGGTKARSFSSLQEAFQALSHISTTGNPVSRSHKRTRMNPVGRGKRKTTGRESRPPASCCLPPPIPVHSLMTPVSAGTAVPRRRQRWGSMVWRVGHALQRSAAPLERNEQKGLATRRNSRKAPPPPPHRSLCSEKDECRYRELCLLQEEKALVEEIHKDEAPPSFVRWQPELYDVMDEGLWVALGYGSKEVFLLLCTLALRYHTSAGSTHSAAMVAVRTVEDVLEDVTGPLVQASRQVAAPTSAAEQRISTAEGVTGRPTSTMSPDKHAFRVALYQLQRWRFITIAPGSEQVRLAGSGSRVRDTLAHLLTCHPDWCEDVLGMDTQEMLHARSLLIS